MATATPIPLSNKLLIVLIDGIGDVSVSSLAGKTPLQAAHLPHLDNIARKPIHLLFLISSYLSGLCLQSMVLMVY
jgi:2,3-bisphosphoglycerate-independent phosphoglycerate mutase